MVLLSADVKKAFPSIPRGKMLNAVKDMGVSDNLYSAVAATYVGNTSVVLTSDHEPPARMKSKTGCARGAFSLHVFTTYSWPGSYER